MAQHPMFPLWTDAYLGDTTHLTTTEHGAYLLLLIAMWRTSDKRLPHDDKLLARYARLTAGQWKRIKPVLMPFFKVHGDRISQPRLTDEANAVRQRSQLQSDKAKARWLKEKETTDATAMPEACLPYPTHLKKESTNVDSKETEPEGSAGGQAAADDSPAKPVPRKVRYPTAANLPKNGKGPHYPEDYDAFWRVFPTRREDTKLGCYKHWRRQVVDNGVDPAVILAAAERYAAANADNNMRIGCRRWCDEGLWNQPALERRASPAAPVSYPGEW